MKQSKDGKLEGVVFDIDGVLVDTRKSYLEAIRIAVELYLIKILKFQKARTPLLTLKDVEMFKMLGGFNNDWDCVEGLVLYFLSLLESEKYPHSIAELQRKKNIKKLLTQKDKSFLKIRRRFPLVSYPKIVEVFQEIYLGKNICQRLYQKKNFFWKKDGLYRKERLLLGPQFFKHLKQRGLRLGIATGRTGLEARMVLKRFGLEDFFECLLTADDIQKAEKNITRREGKKISLAKPHPYCLLENAKRLSIRRFVYIGDLPDDVKTARKAGQTGLTVKPVGFLVATQTKSVMRKELRRAGARAIVNTKKELEALLKSWA